MKMPMSAAELTAAVEQTIIKLADERDAAIKQRDAWEEESRDNAHALEMAVNQLSRATGQRDRALALLRTVNTDRSADWWAQVAALLAEVDG